MKTIAVRGLFCGLLIASASVLAAPLAPFNFSCPNGGNLVVNADWDPASGKLTYSATTNNCRVGNSTVSGTLNGSGTLSVENGSYRINVTTTANRTITGGDNLTSQCNYSINGLLNPQTGTASGSFSNGCTGTGTGSGRNLLDMLLPTDY